MTESEKQQEMVSEEELALINQYTRRPMTGAEVYVFTVVLCDNEVDRDHERFTVEALRQLAQLFLGKTGIFDHSAKTEHQAARIFDTWLEEDETRLTTDGEVYTRLLAKAYLPRSEKTSQLMLEIDSGIKKEVSVGCAMAKRVCSICGADKTAHSCDHRKGQAYQLYGVEKVAHDILSNPTDAYEWSFVAVPAQRQAGVIKTLSGDGGQFDLQKLFLGEDVMLTKEAAAQLKNHLTALEAAAASGRRYRETVEEDVKTLSRIVQPTVPSAVVNRLVQGMTLADLESLQKAYRQKAAEALPIRPQLWQEPKATEDKENAQFQI